MDDDKGPQRKIIYLPRSGELFTQPRDTGPERETVEQKNRQRFAGHFNFADPLTGLPNTFDEKGNYNCGRCNQENSGYCLLLKGAPGKYRFTHKAGTSREKLQLFKVDETAGSCGDWEVKDASDTEMVLNEKDPKVASYGVAKNGAGFGCWRCPYASKAYEADSRGRDLYCGKGDFRTYQRACCSLNGAPTK